MLIISGKDDLAAVLTGIGPTETHLVIVDAVNVIVDLEIPFNVTLRIDQGGSLEIDPGITVTVKGSIDAGIYQIFTGKGKLVKFKTGKTSEVRPEWWGAKGDWSNSDPPPGSTTDDTDAIQRAIDFFGGSVVGDTGGAVRFRATGYRCQGELQLNDGIRLVGTSRAGFAQAGTVLRHDPPAPLPFIHAVSGNPAYGYANVGIEHVHLLGSYDWKNKTGNSESGLYLDGCRVMLKDVAISSFEDWGLRIGYGISSTFEKVSCSQCETGMLVDMGSHTPDGVSTTLCFLNCSFNLCTIGVDLGANVNSVWMGGNTYFEGNTEVGIRINHCGQVTLEGCYWEANKALYLQAGNNGAVQSLRVTNPTLIGGGNPNAGPEAHIHDILSLDDVVWAHIEFGVVASGPRASLLRTTGKTVKVFVRSPAHTSSPLQPGVARKKNHPYKAGDVIQVDEEGSSSYGVPRILHFVCIEGGSSENLDQGSSGWTERYIWNGKDVADGAAKFTMTDSYCVENHGSLTVMGTLFSSPAADDPRLSTRRLELRDQHGHGWWNVQTGYAFTPQDFIINNQAPTGGKVFWARSAIHGRGNEIVLGGDPDNPWLHQHNFEIKRNVRISAAAGSGLEALQLNQEDEQGPFIDFKGAHDECSMKNITGPTEEARLAGFVRVSINGKTFWMPFYALPDCA